MRPCVFVGDEMVVPLKSDRQNSIEHTLGFFGRSAAAHAGFAPAEEPIDALLRDRRIIGDVPMP
jgi:hypothetical protein